MRTLGALVRACHPEPALLVTLVATALAASVDGPAGRVFAAFLAGQLTTGWTNDWRDRDRDLATGRTDKPVGLPASGRRAGRAGRRRRLRAAVAGAWACARDCGTSSPSPRPPPTTCGSRAPLLSWLPYAVSFGLVPSVVTLTVGTVGAVVGVGGRGPARRRRPPGQHAARPRGRPRHRRPRAAAPARAAASRRRPPRCCCSSRPRCSPSGRGRPGRSPAARWRVAGVDRRGGAGARRGGPGRGRRSGPPWWSPRSTSACWSPAAAPSSEGRRRLAAGASAGTDRARSGRLGG